MRLAGGSRFVDHFGDAAVDAGFRPGGHLDGFSAGLDPAVEAALGMGGLVVVEELEARAVGAGEDEEVVLRVVDQRVHGTVGGRIGVALLGVEPGGLLGAEADHHVQRAAHEIGEFVGVAPTGAEAAVDRGLPAGVGQPGRARTAHRCRRAVPMADTADQAAPE
ncbi:MAG: hypothetical protein M5R36_27150 [Deltaproteobacteria bacterium]|nr:hypothetical protein [Deltaproteobacteria bacterium]